MASHLQLIREVAITNTREGISRTVGVYRAAEGVFIEDCGSFERIADDSDTAIMDAIREQGFVIA
jgi:predicted sugar kinase